MEKLYKDKKWLHTQYWDNNLFMHEIAQITGCSWGTIRYWLIKHGIRTRSKAEAVKLAFKKNPEYRRKQAEGSSKARKVAWAQGVYEGVFQTEECRKERSERMRGANSPCWKGGPIKRSCEICGKRFEATHPEIGKGHARFCSRECYGRWCSINRVGPVNPSWKGGVSFAPYPTVFNRPFKESIRERDSFTCAICRFAGRSVHHINYVKNDTTPENCIVLCRSCHGVTGGNREYWQVTLAKLMVARIAFQPLNYDYTKELNVHENQT